MSLSLLKLLLRENSFVAPRETPDQRGQLGPPRFLLTHFHQRHALPEPSGRNLIAFREQHGHLVKFGDRLVEQFLAVITLAYPVLRVVGHLAGGVGLDVLAELADGEIVVAAAVVTIRRRKELIRIAGRDLSKGGKLR